MTTVTVCVGSSCHIKGARKVIDCFNELLKRHGLENEVELRGSFCMERCGETFERRIVHPREKGGRPAGESG